MAIKTLTPARIACLGIVLGMTFCLGSLFRPEGAATAGARESTPKQQFLAGTERSLPILMEISQTLKRIDSRLENIEKTVTEAARRPADR